MSQSTHTVLILESKPFFEHDKRCICFAKETGKLTCLAKYAAKPSKKKVWSLEPLTIASVTLFKGKSFHIITNYSVTHHFQNIRTSFNHLQYALFFTHIIKKCINEGQENKQLFNLIQETLTLCNKLAPLSKIKSYFYNDFTRFEGIQTQETIKQESQYLNDIGHYLGYRLNPPLQLDERSKTLVK
tara:strand:+ start:92 stop:649 length:558 start_codon:yes stop_codon:yes gene_type:complete